MREASGTESTVSPRGQTEKYSIHAFLRRLSRSSSIISGLRTIRRHDDPITPRKVPRVSSTTPTFWSDTFHSTFTCQSAPTQTWNVIVTSHESSARAAELSLVEQDDGTNVS